jgi:hypothetical protein
MQDAGRTTKLRRAGGFDQRPRGAQRNLHLVLKRLALIARRPSTISPRSTAGSQSVADNGIATKRFPPCRAIERERSYPLPSGRFSAASVTRNLDARSSALASAKVLTRCAAKRSATGAKLPTIKTFRVDCTTVVLLAFDSAFADTIRKDAREEHYRRSTASSAKRRKRKTPRHAHP